MATAPIYGLIILGNSGVGKSFLANRLLNDDEAFESRFSAKSVTRFTEWKHMQTNHGECLYAVGNIPGLIEANQQLVDSNRHEIMNAFEQYPLSIVIFVFGHKNGRIPDEDLVAFTRITDAYRIDPQSLIIIINGIPADRPDDYEQRTAPLIHQLTNAHINHIYFNEKTTSEEGKQHIHELLQRAVAQCHPTQHVKKQDIILITDEIAHLKALSKQRQEQLLAQAEEHAQRQYHRQTSDIVVDQRPRQLQRQRSQIQVDHSFDDQLAEQNRKFDEWIKTEQMKFQQTTEQIQSQMHDPTRRATLQLAHQIKRDCERQQEIIERVPSPPQFIIATKEKKADKFMRKITQSVFGSDSSDQHIVHSPTPLDGQRGAHAHLPSSTLSSLPPHPYDPHSCRHDLR